MKKNAAIAKVAKKVEEAEKLAERVLLATRELHNALMGMWDAENKIAIGAVHAALKDHKRICYQDGDEIEGWDSGCIQQADTVLMVLERFEILFQDFIEAKS